MHADDTPHCRCKTWYLYKSRQANNKVEMLKKKKNSKIIGAALAAPAAPVPTPLNISTVLYFFNVQSNVTYPTISGIRHVG